jgi:hypothetical protein
LVAYHYPPYSGSSGVQRTLAFSRYLAASGWDPVVLTATASSYDQVASAASIPADVPIVRAFAPDAARHLAIKGRYWSRIALPDRWRTWWLTAVPAGLAAIRRFRPQLIWSTYPLATAHAIAATLARRSGLPWVADFRDPMVEDFPDLGILAPSDPALRAARLRVERRTVESAGALVFCTESARRIVRERYPACADDHLHVISNGFDEQDFEAAEAMAPTQLPSGKRILLHSGTIYPGPDRDPTALMVALRELKAAGVVSAANFELRLRNPSHEEYFRRMTEEFGVADLVTILPPLPYHQSLAEMCGANGLLLLQGYTSNPAVPAKLYEYLRARRPILALVNDQGESAATLRTLGISSLAELTDADAAQQLLSLWLRQPGIFSSMLPERSQVNAFARESLTAKLAAVMDPLARNQAATRRSVSDCP